ncbi:hypothetical protein NIES2101_14110 [Calothrix sp. HK-06]|nr:hypothetical protein NIES2101_14110 [Calothrix sp. HK-06]
MSNYAGVSVDNFGNVGGAGKLTINANSLQLSDKSSIGASSISSKEGNITIQADNLQMRHQSQITTNASGTGNGGNINIDANTNINLENSDITANIAKEIMPYFTDILMTQATVTFGIFIISAQTTT